MLRFGSLLGAGLVLASLLAHGSAAAQGYYYPPPPPAYAPPPPPAYAPPPSVGAPSNVVTYPDGSVSVTRTPEQGVDVHAPTASGMVRAYGCDRVDVDARMRAAPAPCPTYYQPYPVYTPVYTPYAYPAPQVYLPPRPSKPPPPPDPARTGALIASSLVFGLGTMAAGTAYLASTTDNGCALPEGCPKSKPSKPALYALGGFLTAPPSVPRYVVGEVGVGLLLTALRGTAFALGTLVDWQDESYTVPVMLAFVTPATLGIVDLATTPRRDPAELNREHSDSASAGVRLHALGPTATVDRRGALAPALGAAGTF